MQLKKDWMKLGGLILAISLNGCLMLSNVKPDCSPPKIWNIPEGKTLSDFYFNKYICTITSQHSDVDGAGREINWNSFNDCMKSYGYTPKEEAYVE